MGDALIAFAGIVVGALLGGTGKYFTQRRDAWIVTRASGLLLLADVHALCDARRSDGKSFTGPGSSSRVSKTTSPCCPTSSARASPDGDATRKSAYVQALDRALHRTRTDDPFLTMRRAGIRRK
jgi:hypothetical protein